MKKIIALAISCVVMTSTTFAAKISDNISGEVGIKERSESINGNGSVQLNLNVKMFNVIYAEAQYQRTEDVVDYDIDNTKKSIGGGIFIPIKEDLSLLIAGGIGSEKIKNIDTSSKENKEEKYDFYYGKVGFNSLLKYDIHLLGYYKYTLYQKTEVKQKKSNHDASSIGIGVKFAPSDSWIRLDGGVEIEDMKIAPYLGVGIKF